MKDKPRIDFTSNFNKQREKAPLKIKEAFREALEIFIENPSHPALRNHSLTEKYAGIYSIDVTDDWRALYRREKGSVVFMHIGTHHQLYKASQRR